MKKMEAEKFIRYKLSTDEVWAKRALLVIYSRQTEDEKNAETTVHANHVGFSQVDAEILSSFSQQLERRNFLSGKQMGVLYKRIPKYWKQVLNACDKKKLEGWITKWLADGAPTQTAR